jgi:predicted dehydrogenase
LITTSSGLIKRSPPSKAGVKFQVGFNRRFDPNFRRCADGRHWQVGAPRSRITMATAAPGIREGLRRRFLDMTIHDFDMALLDGGEVTECTAGAVLVGRPSAPPETWIRWSSRYGLQRRHRRD